MIHCEPVPEHGYVELTVDGSVDRAAFEAVIATLEPLLAERGRVGFLERIVSFGGMPPSVLWDDLRFVFKHRKEIGPVAVVSDKRWIEVWTKLASPFWSTEVSFFTADELEDARAWMVERMATDGD